MKIKVCEYTKYGVKSTSAFDKNLKKVYKQGKDLEKLITIVTKLANGEQLDPKYKNHYLTMDIKKLKNVTLSLTGY